MMMLQKVAFHLFVCLFCLSCFVLFFLFDNISDHISLCDLSLICHKTKFVIIFHEYWSVVIFISVNNYWDSSIKKIFFMICGADLTSKELLLCLFFFFFFSFFSFSERHVILIQLSFEIHQNWYTDSVTTSFFINLKDYKISSFNKLWYTVFSRCTGHNKLRVGGWKKRVLLLRDIRFHHHKSPLNPTRFAIISFIFPAISW